MLGALLLRARHPARRPEAVRLDRGLRQDFPHLLQRDWNWPIRASNAPNRPRAKRRRRGAHRRLPAAVPPRAAGHEQRGCGQQLRSRPLHGRQADHRPGGGPPAQAGRPVRGPAGLPRFPLVRRRHRLGLHVAAHGAPVGRLRQEGQARVRRLPVAAAVQRRRRAVQRHPHDAHDARALGLRVHGRQRGHLRHLPEKSRRRAGELRQPEPPDRAGGVFDHGVAALRRRAQRRPHRVPDEPGALPAHPLPAGDLRAHCVRRQGVPRAAVRRRPHQRLLRADQSDGAVRPASRQVHGLLSALSRRHRLEGHQRGGRHDQDEEEHPIRRLVPDRLQDWHQRPAADGGARRRPGQGAACRLHAEQHDRHSRSVGAARPQVRPHVRQARLRPLVRRRGHGGGRVLRGARRPRRSREGLRGGGRRLLAGRRRRRGRRGILAAADDERTPRRSGAGARTRARALLSLARRRALVEPTRPINASRCVRFRFLAGIADDVERIGNFQRAE